jgi:hypothetical protein
LRFSVGVLFLSVGVLCFFYLCFGFLLKFLPVHVNRSVQVLDVVLSVYNSLGMPLLRIVLSPLSVKS